MITADTSVLVAGFTPEHEFHEQVQPDLVRIAEEGRLISHTIAEAYSVQLCGTATKLVADDGL